jgi:phosphoglycerate dehydrogenase-like enzyme
VFPPSQITHMMPQCDYVVCCTPYTPDTHELVSAAAITAMKPNAVLINVGRGKCVDEQALIQGTACANCVVCARHRPVMCPKHRPPLA